MATYDDLLTWLQGGGEANTPLHLARLRRAALDRSQEEQAKLAQANELPTLGPVDPFSGSPSRTHPFTVGPSEAYTVPQQEQDLAEDPNTGTAAQARTNRMQDVLDFLSPQATQLRATQAKEAANTEQMGAQAKAYGAATGASAAGIEPNAEQLAKEASARKIAETTAPIYAARSGVGIGSEVRTTPGGTPYVDMSQFKGADYHNALAEAQAQGVKTLSAPEATGIEKVNAARAGLQDIIRSVPKLPTSALTRNLGAGMLNKVESYLQLDPDLAAWGVYRNTAIQALQAIAGGAGSGLRINQAEIALSVANDIPDITDTQEVAKQKLDRVQKLLKNQEESILGLRDPYTPDSLVPRGSHTSQSATQSPMGKDLGAAWGGQ